MQTQLRYWEYYGMTTTFEGLYGDSKSGKTFDRLYELIISRENILLAYRTIKSNKGSQTAGCDGKTINDFKRLSDDELVKLIQTRLSNYRPKKVRRVYIPKPNGKLRPLGIPSMSDRIIQQAFKQVLEPVCEAKFYNHSYGFRPLRTTKHAIARTNSLINMNKLHFAVDVDIEGFFDNVNHSLLLKQLWNIGIKDRKVLAIISKMLKAEIEGEGIPTKGTPQGGILSPLLSNVVLNDLDQWIASQWEFFNTEHTYRLTHKYRALKKTNLKEGYIVRYADDFKIFCRDRNTATKWFHAVRLYLKDRLKLDISPEKSKIVNLRKKKSEFLGIELYVVKKKDKMVAQSKVSKKNKEKIVKEGRKRIIEIQKHPTADVAQLYNSWVLGIQNYYRTATLVNLDFNLMAFRLSQTLKLRLGKCSKYGRPQEPSETYKRLYNTNYKTYKIGNVHLFPMFDVKHSSSMNYSQNVTPFTKEGRTIIYSKLKDNILNEISRMLTSYLPNQSVEYFDNRISRYSMKNGLCEITGTFLKAEDVHCHHYKPKSLNGDDSFNNLRIIHKFVHVIIHASNLETINKYREILKLTDIEIKRINKYRKECNLEPIEV
ncbi:MULTISPECIES: group II intron reverse transcriptase/maturase [Cytobacillus]|uniref:Group II intron reverse transcriptase/maturase n=2 Tax=Cytobacillus TaxID=2675230 RepID=A0AA46SGY4_CYTFI|nr:MULTISPECIES: group II intron reverse transcriptase/maturase [Cytobacillus]AND43170.1 group II intron reverse transcriptase/maturase [Cytobacillus oceanisediminis 2691]MCM3245581.1 group II intron reverse transcriptase/maturase [Cytobacillus oceanisediminis]USK47282.1 group II intron reverse transcriptase/maturase [Cytobacillus oceanisediminis]UYG98273.1 group II intron reverse transcriptase/maturase [Cytobacillus firmus]